MQTSAAASRRNLRKARAERRPSPDRPRRARVVAQIGVTCRGRSASSCTQSMPRQLQLPPLRALLPSRVGAVLVLLALLLPAAAGWASTVVTCSAVGQTMADLPTASNASAASRLQPRLSPGRILLRSRVPQQRRLEPERSALERLEQPDFRSDRQRVLRARLVPQQLRQHRVSRDLSNDEALNENARAQTARRRDLDRRRIDGRRGRRRDCHCLVLTAGSPPARAVALPVAATRDPALRSGSSRRS
jgi:hypothetical protein